MTNKGTTAGQRRTNEYKKFSKIEQSTSPEVHNLRTCPTCTDGCRANIGNICVNCYYGDNNHKKLGRPKPKDIA